MQRPPAPPPRRTRRPVWPIVVGASTIVGLLAGGVVALRARGTDPPPPPSGLSAAPETCAPPECDRIVSLVTLRWIAPADPSVTGFRVLRDGAPAVEGLHLSPGTVQFVDRFVSPGQQHVYMVVATSPDGDSPPSSGVEAQIPLPPLAAAQLKGVYDVDLVVHDARNLASLSGIRRPEPRDTRGTTWGFQPLCRAEQGACPTRWTGRSGVLTPRGVVWSGRVLGPEARCPDGTREPSPIHVRLRALDAAMLVGVWTVTAVEGAYSVGFRCAGFLPSRGTVVATGRHR